MTDAPGLGGFFQPAAIAIVGATGKADSLFARPLQYLLRFGYEGPIYPVTPKYEEIEGVRCYPSLESIGQPVDLVLSLVNADLVPSIVESSAAIGAGAVIVYASGFGETGEDGRAKEAALVQLARAKGVRLLGPNCQGVYEGTTGVAATFTGALGLDLPTPAGLAYIGQSGALGGSALDLGRERGIGFSSWVSTGNEADVTSTELAEHLAARDDVSTIALYLETLRDGERFLSTARLCAERGKSLVVLRTGRSEAGQRAAASHTGSLVPVGESFDAAARALGVVNVDTVDELLDCAAGRLRYGGGHGGRIAVVSSSGGAGGLAADAIALSGLELADFTGETAQELSTLIPAFGSAENPVDVTAQLFSGTGSGFVDVAVRVAQDPQVDQLVILLTVVGGAQATALAKQVAAAVAEVDKPLHFVWMVGHDQTQEARQVLRQAAVPVYGDIASAVRVMQALTVRPLPTEGTDDPPVDPRFAQLPSTSLTEAEAAAVLEAAGVPLPRNVVVDRPEAAAAAVRDVGGRAVLKIQAPSILHKSELGLVRLGVDESDAAAVAADILDRADADDVQGVLVQEQLAAGLEMLVAVRRERADLPPVLTVGMGGVMVELLDDVVNESLPVDDQRIRDMVGRLRHAPLLTGFRGGPAHDVDGLVSAVRAVARAAALLGPRLVELEINPLIVQPGSGGAVAADALVTLRPIESPEQN